jgi:hypothetical protein
MHQGRQEGWRPVLGFRYRISFPGRLFVKIVFQKGQIEKITLRNDTKEAHEFIPEIHPNGFEFSTNENPYARPIARATTLARHRAWLGPQR